MPIFRHGEAPPAWCELRGFEILDLEAGGADAERQGGEAKLRLLCTLGTVQVVHPGGSAVLKENQFLDLAGSATWRARACAPKAQLVALGGRWGEEIAGCGVFRAADEPNATDGGDPVGHRKTTRVDSHYHDCDEYWILLEGRATVVVGDASTEMRPGDGVSIGMGHHHDMPRAPEPVKAVFFETTLERERRVGHLWNHTHGPANPHPERI